MAGRFIAKEVIDRHGAFINRGDHEREVRELLDRIAELEGRDGAPQGDYDDESSEAFQRDFGDRYLRDDDFENLEDALGGLFFESTCPDCGHVDVGPGEVHGCAVVGYTKLEDADEECAAVMHDFGFDEKCPNALLPDGPVCPRCGGNRAPSGVDGGSWVHFDKKSTS